MSNLVAFDEEKPMRQMAAPTRDVSTQAMVFDPDTVMNMQRMAEMMASARVTIPKHLAGSPGDCLAVVMQAAQWQMNPFAVAQKTHLVNGTLGYEAQLVAAVASSSRLLKTRLSYEWEGDWKGVNGKSDKDDSRACTVSATLIGEIQPRTLRVSMAQVGGVRNSPLWDSDPRQQLAYLATKRWARLHCPDVMLGVYSVDELQDAQERDMGPAQVVQVAPQPPAASRTDAVKAKLRPALDKLLEALDAAETEGELRAAAELGRGLEGEDKKKARAAFDACLAALRERAAAAAQVDTETGELLQK